jgi:hypothetical protein
VTAPRLDSRDSEPTLDTLALRTWLGFSRPLSFAERLETASVRIKAVTLLVVGLLWVDLDILRNQSTESGK